MKLLRLTQVMEKTALSRATIYRLIRADRFPRPIKAIRVASRWLDPEVDEWIAQRVNERDELIALRHDTATPATTDEGRDLDELATAAREDEPEPSEPATAPRT